MENNRIDIEMADMVVKTYTLVANWYNQDFETAKGRQEALKQTCAEVIQQVLEDTFNQLDGVGGVGAKTVVNDDIKNKEDGEVFSENKMFSPQENPLLKNFNKEE